MGIEQQWIKQDPSKSSEILKVSPEEWQKAKAVARLRIANKEKPPFKLSKEELRELFPKHAQYFNHDLLVLPTQDGSYKVGVMASSEVFVNADNEEVREGILGHGAYGVVKIIQWENGEVDAVKIEAASKEQEHAAERQIMHDLGYLRATFVERRKASTPWIGGVQAQDLLYTVQQRHVGIEMKDYFRSIKMPSLDNLKKYQIALKAAAAIEKLHDQGILHCDVKPANFLINWQGDIAVVTAIDFGLSMRLKDGENLITTDPKGTPKYVAPEIFEYQRDADGQLHLTRDQFGEFGLTSLSADGQYSKAADIFSLGIMFRDDLGLGEPKSPLHDLVTNMTSRNPKERPSIHEVTAALLNPDNYNKFKQLYKNTDQYITQKALQKKGSLFFQDKRIKASDQVDMVKALEETLKQYRLSMPPDATEAAILEDNTVKQILQIMKDNQNRHEKSIFSTASTFNIQTLQSLPDELRKGVCKKLGIEENSKILKEINYSTRKELAAIISKYTPSTTARPSL